MAVSSVRRFSRALTSSLPPGHRRQAFRDFGSALAEAARLDSRPVGCVCRSTSSFLRSSTWFFGPSSGSDLTGSQGLALGFHDGGRGILFRRYDPDH